MRRRPGGIQASAHTYMWCACVGAHVRLHGTCLLNDTVVLLGERTYTGTSRVGTVLRQANDTHLPALMASDVWVRNQAWTGGWVFVVYLLRFVVLCVLCPHACLCVSYIHTCSVIQSSSSLPSGGFVVVLGSIQVAISNATRYMQVHLTVHTCIPNACMCTPCDFCAVCAQPQLPIDVILAICGLRHTLQL